MELIDWDIYAKSYEDTQHLVGRPDLAQKHYVMIGKDQGRDTGFDAVLVYCTSPECPDEESARTYYLNLPVTEGVCRSRRSLIQYVLQEPGLAACLPENSDYLLGPVVDEVLFSLYIEKTRKPLNELIGFVVQRVTEELISDISIGASRGELPLISNPASPSAPVFQRPSLVKVASRRDYIIELDCILTIGDSACHVLTGSCIDPDRQIEAIRLVTGDKRIDVTSQLVYFQRPAKARELLGAYPGLDMNNEKIGWALLLGAGLLGNQTPDGIEVQSPGNVSALIRPQSSDIQLLDLNEIRSFWGATHNLMYELLAGDLSQMPQPWLQKILPDRASPSNPVQFDIESFFSFDDRQILIANLRDPQHRLKAMYLSHSDTSLQLLSDNAVRGLGEQDEKGPREYFLANSKGQGNFDEQVSLYGLLDHGQWFRLDRTVEPVTAEMLLRSLVQIFESLQGKVFDRVYDMIVRPVVDSLFAPQTFKNPAYQMQSLGEANTGSVNPDYSALIYATHLHSNLVAQVSQLELAVGKPGAIEVLLYVEKAPAAKELDFYIKQFQWFNLEIRVFSAPSQQGYGRTVNQLAKHTRGATLVLLNEQVLPASPNWLGELEAELAADGVGVALPLSVNVGGTIENAGYTFEKNRSGNHWEVRNQLRSLPLGHLANRSSYDTPFGMLQAAVVRKSGFDRLGGLADDLQDMDLCSIDYCLRVRAQNRKVMLNPHVQFKVFSPKANTAQADQGRSELLKRYKSKVINHRWAAVIEEYFAGWRIGLNEAHSEANSRKGVLDILKGFR